MHPHRHLPNPFKLTGTEAGPVQAPDNLSTPNPRVLTVTFPDAAKLGETASHTITVGSIKNAITGAGAPGELVMDDLPAVAKELGWAIDPLKLPLGPGDKKPITFKYTAPKEAQPTMAAYHGMKEYVELSIGCTLKGGLPAPISADGLKLMLRVRCLVEPAEK